MGVTRNRMVQYDMGVTRNRMVQYDIPSTLNAIIYNIVYNLGLYHVCITVSLHGIYLTNLCGGALDCIYEVVDVDVVAADKLCYYMINKRSNRTVYSPKGVNAN
jgi:hypothetical protein